ncbi:large ribosomal subunit protein mL64 [Cyrtonyx montezumae]|uniref:large ribosomal subunit protein mL64 n=1 Tax=Cyrtonyx montezumae TaxID=9017 RepID=UPI0032DBB0A8
MAALTPRCVGPCRGAWAALRPYRALPLRRRVGPPPLTDPGDQRAAAKRFGRLGAASGVAAERLWPDPERLREMEAEEREWCPSLREMEAELERKEREERRLREEREQLVARSLAAMPARIAAWRQEREQKREQSRQDAARRQRLLAEAAERLGGPARPGDPRVQALMQDLERERRRQEKRQRRRQHEEAARSALAAAEAAAASQPPPGASEPPK